LHSALSMRLAASVRRYEGTPASVASAAVRSRFAAHPSRESIPALFDLSLG
jgi:hypothetical protein